eukprot:226177_1
MILSTNADISKPKNVLFSESIAEGTKDIQPVLLENIIRDEIKDLLLKGVEAARNEMATDGYEHENKENDKNKANDKSWISDNLCCKFVNDDQLYAKLKLDPFENTKKITISYETVINIWGKELECEIEMNVNETGGKFEVYIDGTKSLLNVMKLHISKKIEDDAKIEIKPDYISITPCDHMISVAVDLSDQKEEKLSDIDAFKYYVFENMNSAKVFDVSVFWPDITQSDIDICSSQIFQVKPLNNGFFAVQNIQYNGLYWGIAGNSTDNGAKLTLHEWTGGANQQFLFSSARDGAYVINIRHSGKVLIDVPSARMIQQWERNTEWKSGIAQLFYVKKIGIAEGTYVFENINSHKVLDVNDASKNNGAKIIQSAYNAGSNQQFIVKQLDKQYYSVQCVNSNLFWDIAGHSAENGAKLTQHEWNGGANQQFVFLSTNDGAYVIYIRHSGKVIDVPGATMRDTAEIQQWERNTEWKSGVAQIFYAKKQ